MCKNDSFNVKNLDQQDSCLEESLFNLVPLQVNFIKPFSLKGVLPCGVKSYEHVISDLYGFGYISYVGR